MIVGHKITSVPDSSLPASPRYRMWWQTIHQLHYFSAVRLQSAPPPSSMTELATHQVSGLDDPKRQISAILPLIYNVYTVCIIHYNCVTLSAFMSWTALQYCDKTVHFNASNTKPFHQQEVQWRHSSRVREQSSWDFPCITLSQPFFTAQHCSTLCLKKRPTFDLLYSLHTLFDCNNFLAQMLPRK